jgi:hypothetical protein
VLLLGGGRHGYKETNNLSSLLHSRAASTVKNFLTQYRKFTNFVKESQLPGKFAYTTLVFRTIFPTSKKQKSRIALHYNPNAP